MQATTPLYNAISRGELCVVEFLVEIAGEDVNVSNTSGYTPLHEASSRGDIKIVEYLVGKACANIHAYDRYGRTSIDEASYFCRGEVEIYLRKVRLEQAINK